MTQTQNNNDISQEEMDEFLEMAEANHPFTMVTTILFHHVDQDKSPIEAGELYDRVLTLATDTVQGMVDEEARTEIEKQMSEMLKENPDADETDMWFGLISSEPEIMPELLGKMVNLLSKITHDLSFQEEEEMYEALEHYTEIYKKSAATLLN